MYLSVDADDERLNCRARLQMSLLLYAFRLFDEEQLAEFVTSSDSKNTKKQIK